MTITRMVSPRNDYAFKRLFGQEKNKDITMSLLNAFLGNQIQRKIVDVTFLKTIQEPEIASKKQSIVDLLCTDQDGCHYVIEI